MKHVLFILSVIVVAFVSVALPPGKPVSISGSHVWTNDTSGVALMSIRNIGLNTNTAPTSAWDFTVGFQYDINNGVYSEVIGSGIGTTTNTLAILNVTANGPNDNSVVQIFSKNDDANDLNAAYVDCQGVTNHYYLGEGTTKGSGLFIGNTVSATIGGVVTASQYVISGTTNQVVFGATNTPPVGSVSTPSKWISVQVAGESVVYRLPLYQ